MRRTQSVGSREPVGKQPGPVQPFGTCTYLEADGSSHPMTDDRALVREYQGLCWHIVQRMVRHPEDARELCQDTFLKVHQHLYQYRHDSALKSWIGHIAYTVALRHLERKRIAIVDNALGEDGDLSLLDSLGDGRDLEADCADDEMHAICSPPSIPCRHCHAPCSRSTIWTS